MKAPCELAKIIGLNLLSNVPYKLVLIQKHILVISHYINQYYIICEFISLKRTLKVI